MCSGFIILSAEAAAILFPASNHKGLRRNKTDRYEIESLTPAEKKKQTNFVGSVSFAVYYLKTIVIFHHEDDSN